MQQPDAQLSSTDEARFFAGHEIPTNCVDENQRASTPWWAWPLLTAAVIFFLVTMKSARLHIISEISKITKILGK